MMPRKQAVRHKTTLSAIFPIALIKLPCWRSASVSKENVENVVKPPRKPTKIAKRSSSETWTRSNNVKDRSPINNEPTIFTTRVPYGKSLPNQCTDCV